MQSNFPKIQLFLSVIFLIFSCLLFLFFYREVNNKNIESQLKEMQLQKETRRRDEIKALNNSVKIIEEEKTKLETHFAKSSDVVPFLDTIEALAVKVGAKAEVVSVDILKDNTGLLVGMSAGGDFEGLYKFLTLLENSSYELEFVTLDINRKIALSAVNKSVIISEWNAVLKIKLLSFVK